MGLKAGGTCFGMLKDSAVFQQKAVAPVGEAAGA